MLGDYSVADNHAIDAVITWVDGSDPVFRQKIVPYLKNNSCRQIPGAHPTRFASVNEIRYCVFSIFTFAPFVRNIFIVTDGQDPQLDKEIVTYFPERANSIKIVDHKEIFRGFEQYLPTFNSRSIECMIWRIKGLSERFIYFNDDTFLIRETRPEDWFINNRPVLRGKWLLLPALRILWKKAMIIVNKDILNRQDYQPRPSYHVGQWLAASQLGFKFNYLAFCHTPHAINRRRVEDFFNNNMLLLEKSISYRFRNHNQLNFIALSYHLEILNDNRNLKKPDLLYLQPVSRESGYFDRKIRLFEKNHDIKFMCVQSLEMCSQKELNKIFGWLNGVLKLSK
jgi:hypothetical protein